MKPKNDEIRIVKAEPHIVKNQNMYFGSRGANPEAICSAISQGALILGASETNVKETDGWWSISANLDWLSSTSISKIDEKEIFKTLAPFQEAGVNWHRSEIMANVFSEGCFTIKSGVLSLVPGVLPDPITLERISLNSSEWARVVVFKFREMA